MNPLNYKLIDNQFDMGIYPKRDLVLIKGLNALVQDEYGNEYIDCVAGHGVASVGHCNPYIIQAISNQANQLITCPGTFYNDSRSHFLEKLAGILPQKLNRIFLCNSGTETIEAALKFARFSTRKPGFISAMKGFHGRTLGALSATFNPRYKEDFLPLLNHFHFVPYNHFKKLQDMVKQNDGNIAGILLEPVQGEGGVNIGSPNYFHQVRQLCDQKGILLILDEVQTGFCRTGKMFAFQHLGIVPDILCLAKAIAGGLPMGAVVCSQLIQSPRGKHGSTFGGNPLACAAASAVLDFIQSSNLADQAAQKGHYLLEKLNQLDSPKIREIRGLGLLVGIELREKVLPYLIRLIQERVLALPAGPTVLRLLPPLTISYQQLDQVILAISRVLSMDVSPVNNEE